MHTLLADNFLESPTALALPLGTLLLFLCVLRAINDPRQERRLRGPAEDRLPLAESTPPALPRTPTPDFRPPK